MLSKKKSDCNRNVLRDIIPLREPFLFSLLRVRTDGERWRWEHHNKADVIIIVGNFENSFHNFQPETCN